MEYSKKPQINAFSIIIRLIFRKTGENLFPENFYRKRMYSDFFGVFKNYGNKRYVSISCKFKRSRKQILFGAFFISKKSQIRKI